MTIQITSKTDDGTPWRCVRLLDPALAAATVQARVRRRLAMKLRPRLFAALAALTVMLVVVPVQYSLGLRIGPRSLESILLDSMPGHTTTFTRSQHTLAVHCSEAREC